MNNSIQNRNRILKIHEPAAVVALALAMMLVLTVFATTSVHAQGPNTWTLGAPLPAAIGAPEGAAVGAIGNNIYFAGGSGSTATEIYNTQTNTWTAGSPIPSGGDWGTGAVVDGILYFIGSGTEVLAYNPANDTWSTGLTSMPTTRDSLSAVVDNGIIYVIGGYNGSRDTTVESYNPATNTWAELAPMLVGKSLPGVGLLGTTIVAASGLANSGWTGDTEAYNVATNTWTTMAPDPNTRSNGCSGVIGGQLYFAGGVSNSGPVQVVESYNLATNSWTTLAPMPQATNYPASVVVGNLLYCIGGAAGVGYTQIYQPPVMTILQENFDELTPALGVTSAGAFTAISGTNVDIVGGSNYGYLCVSPESGNCVDLDGTGGNSQGILQSGSITLNPGLLYNLSFDLIGSQRGVTTVTSVTFGPYSRTFYLASNDNTDGIVSVQIAVPNTITTHLQFQSLTAGSAGALLDNVLITATAAPSMPDLVETGVSIVSGTPASGSSLTVSDTVMNQGNGTATPTSTWFYLATSPTAQGGSYLGSRSVPSLAAGASNTGTVQLTLPAGVAGTYYIVACANAGYTPILESNPYNNCTGSAAIIVASADLDETAVSVTGSLQPGGAIQVADTVINLVGVTPISTTWFYLATSATAQSGYYLGSRSVPSLAANASNTATTSLTLPTSVSAGTYYVVACANAGYSPFKESNRANNCLGSPALLIP